MPQHLAFQASVSLWLSPATSATMVAQKHSEAQGGEAGLWSHFKGHKEALVLGSPDSPAWKSGCLSKGHIKVWC